MYFISALVTVQFNSALITVHLFKNSAILKLREEKNVIPMLYSQDQTLDKVSKVFLFRPWRRPEVEIAVEENLAAVTDEDLKACDRIRLELFPASYYCSET